MNVLAPILITGCHLLAGGHGDGTHISANLSVRFEDVGPKAYTTIVWRTTTIAGTYDFIDTGRFPPGAEITRHLQHRGTERLNTIYNVTLDSPKSCTTVSVRYADGTTWINPDVGPTEPPFPLPRPYLNATSTP